MIAADYASTSNRKQNPLAASRLRNVEQVRARSGGTIDFPNVLAYIPVEPDKFET
jgi:hypothetical protein